MGVDSYLELFTTMYGWAFSAIIRDVLVATGIIYLPFIILIISTWMEAHQSAFHEGADAGWMVRKMEIELGSAIFVLAMCFTTVPILSVSHVSLYYTPDKTALNPAPAKVNGGASGSSFDTAFTGIPGNVEVPPWWFTVMGISSGINQAVRTGIGSNVSGFRQLEEMARAATVADPQLAAGIQRFTNECYLPARSKYLASTTALSGAGANALSTYGPADPEWLGSHVYQTEPGYYDTMAAASEVAGFAVSPTQDADVAGSAVPPDNGRPTCNAWWTDLKINLVNKLVVIGRDPTQPVNALTTLGSMASTLIAAPADQIDDAMVRLAINKLRPSIVDPASIIGDDRAWYQKLFQAAFDVPGIAGGIGKSIEAQASKFPLIQFATMAQPLILMAIYTFLPLIVVFSRYSLGVMLLGGLAIFTVKFWEVMWFIARWLDDHLIQAMYPDAATLFGQYLQVAGGGGADAVIKRISLDMLLVGLYIGMPLIWSGMMMWAGINIMRSISTMAENAIDAGMNAGSSGTRIAYRAMGRSRRGGTGR